MAQWSQLGNDIYGENQYDLFGTYVSLNADGTIIAAGSPQNGDGYNYSGHIRIFNLIGNTWTQMGNDIDGSSIMKIGESFDLDSLGTTLVMSSSYQQGIVKVYEYNGTEWIMKGDSIFGYNSTASYGKSVSINSDASIIAFGGDNCVYMYEYSGSEWVMKGDSIIGDVDNVNFGEAVQLNTEGNAIVIGDPNSTYDGGKGQVKVYEFISNNWIQKGTAINNSNSPRGKYTGKSVSINAYGDIIAIGTPDIYVGATGKVGFAIMYSYTGGDWIQIGDSIIGNSEISNMGCSVSLNYEGTMVVIGSRLDDQAGSNSGIASVYNFIGSNWVKVGSDISGQLSNELGTSVSLSSNGLRFAVGSPKDALGWTPYGLAEVYGNDTYSKTPIINNITFIKLYPNPAKEYLIIESESSKLNKIVLVDVSGKLIKIIRFTNESSYKLDLLNIEKGIYFIEITTENEISTQKIVLE
jgi:hypothetical protein